LCHEQVIVKYEEASHGILYHEQASGILTGTARSREAETRKARRNAKRNPRWSSQVSFETSHLKRDLTIEDFDLHFDENFESHLLGIGLYHEQSHFHIVR